MVITSRSNEKVKFLKRLFAEKKARQQENVYIAEGFTLVGDIPTSCKVKSFFVKESKREKCESIFARHPEGEVVLLADGVFDSVADTVSPTGIVAVVERKEFVFPSENLILILDGIADAGNMGTVLRTASACGIDTVVCFHDCCDPYCPKSVRASMGGVCRENILETDEEGIKNLLKDYKLVTLDMGGTSLFQYKKEGKLALAVGNEAHGVSDFLRKITTEAVAIPMAKESVESLNASVAVGIAMYIMKLGE